MRLFVAVRPSAEAAQALAGALGRRPDPRWHVTLAFLGEQPSAEPFDLGAVAARHRPFTVHLAGGGTFGGHVVHARLGGDLPALRSLATDVQGACRAAGAQLEDRPWRPHLTVTRGRALRVPPALREHVGPSWLVEEVELVLSVLGRVARHEVLHRWRLGG